MDIISNVPYSVIFKSGDNILPRRRKLSHYLINSKKDIEEIRRLQQLSIAKKEELQETNKTLSQQFREMEVQVHTLKTRELANKEEIQSLELTITELKKEISVETEAKQHLLVKKNKAETDKERSHNELKKKREVFLKAIAYYKRKLHIRLRFEENGVIIVHFLNISTPECKMCSVKLSYIDGKWGLLGMEPALPCERSWKRNCRQPRISRDSYAMFASCGIGRS